MIEPLIADRPDLWLGVEKKTVGTGLEITFRLKSSTPHILHWGLARRENVNEPEDHIAGICESLRFSIAVQHRSDEEQRSFFERFLYRGGMAFCDAVSASPKAVFYRHVAGFARAFLDVEHEAFGML